jgi:hypothetical protein
MSLVLPILAALAIGFIAGCMFETNYRNTQAAQDEPRKGRYNG